MKALGAEAGLLAHDFQQVDGVGIWKLERARDTETRSSLIGFRRSDFVFTLHTLLKIHKSFCSPVLRKMVSRCCLFEPKK